MQMFGAISFLGTSIIELASSSDTSNLKLQKLSQGMNQGISAGFGLASMMGILGIASGGTAVLIGAVVTIGIALFKMFDDSEAKAKKFQTAMQSLNDMLRGASLNSLEDLRGKLLEVHRQQEQQLTDLDKQAAAWTKWGLLGQLAGLIFANGLEKQRDAVKATLKIIDGYIGESINSIGAKEKSAAEVRDFINQASTAAMIDQFAKQRAEAKLTLDKELEDFKGHADAMAAARSKYRATLRQIDLDEANFNQQLADTQFEAELSRIRTHGTQLGVEQSTIDLQIIEARKRHYQQQLDSLDSLVMSERERTKRRGELEKELTGVIEEETAKRKSVEDAHQAWLDKRSGLSFQKALAELKLYGLQHGEIEEQMQKKALAAEKMFAHGELQILEANHNAGKILDADYLTRKQQLYVKLAQLETSRVANEQQLWLAENQFTVAMYDVLGQGVQSTFIGILNVHRQAKDEMDAIWIDIENLVINALGNILAQQITNFLVQQSLSKVTAAATVATVVPAMAAIATAAFPAAALVSIATFGAADWSALGSFTGALTAMKAVSTGIAGFDEGGKLRRGRAGMFEGNRDEIVAPEADFYAIARAEMIPKMVLETRQTTKEVVQDAMAKTSGIGGRASSKNELHVHVDTLIGTADFVRKDFKKAIQTVMRELGVDNISEVFVNMSKQKVTAS
jgi:hypothetical protein